MRNNNRNKIVPKSILYIGIFTLVMIAILLIAFFIKSKNTTTNSNTNTQNINDSNYDTTTVFGAISIDSETGNQDATIQSDINIPSRKFDFSKSIDEIMEYESSQDDTLNLKDDYEPAKSDDGYTYLTYRFNNIMAPEFFGAQVATSDEDAMLTYVFYKEDLIEVRIGYGSIDSAGYDDIINNLTSLYGAATYSRSYSNGSFESWWKTKDVTLDIVCENAVVIAYYRKSNL